MAPCSCTNWSHTVRVGHASWVCIIAHRHSFDHKVVKATRELRFMGDYRHVLRFVAVSMLHWTKWVATCSRLFPSIYLHLRAVFNAPISNISVIVLQTVSSRPNFRGPQIVDYCVTVWTVSTSICNVAFLVSLPVKFVRFAHRADH